MSFLREKETERKLIHDVKAAGGMAIKLTSPSVDGLVESVVLLTKVHK